MREVEYEDSCYHGIKKKRCYMFGPTGIMKNFLDHVAYACHRPKYFGQKGYVITCCTSQQEKTVSGPMATWLNGAGQELIGTTRVDMLPFPLTEKELNKKRKKIEAGAVRLHKALNRKKVYSPGFNKVVVFHIMRSLCKIEPRLLRADSNYFSSINAYNPKSRWYIKTRVSWVNHFLSRLMEGMVNRMITGMVDGDKLKEAKGPARNKL